LHQEHFASIKLLYLHKAKEAAMKLKQKQKYSYHVAKGSCHNIEATFPSRKTGYDRH
jgi:hypothetical protein